MLDPASEKFRKWNRLAASGMMLGKDRPVTRMTLSKQTLRGVRSDRPGPWRHLLMQPGENEFGRLKSVEISRSLGDSVATCTIVIYNDYMEHYANSPQGYDTLGRPGYLTFNRGDKSPIDQKSVYHQFIGNGHAEYQDVVYAPDGTPTNADGRYNPFPTSWDYPKAGSETGVGVGYYYDRLIPNRLIRTYQGYGSDNMDEDGNMRSVHMEGYVSPQMDTQLTCTGHWLVDQISYSTDGLVTIQCRDIGKIMLEQIVYPPLIPLSRFPLVYCPAKPASGEKGGVSQDLARGYDACSNDVWYGKNANIWGRKPDHAFDGHPGTFWLSVGNAKPSDGYSFEWIQTRVDQQTVNEVHLTMRGGNNGATGYVCFVSVMENGTWQGTQVVPYDPNHKASHPNGANIPYVLRTTIGSIATQVIKLPRAYKAQKVRVCFTNLPAFDKVTGVWDPSKPIFPHRAGVAEFQVRYNKPDTYVASTLGVPGYISDWSEAVKELCAWAGFTWRTRHNVHNGQPEDKGIKADYLIGTSPEGEPLRVWGDFEMLGAGPVECTPNDFFLNKSFMEAAKTIADFLGCILFIDESGGVQFRFPNLFSGGNFIADPASPNAPFYLKKKWPIELHENANLISYQVQISDSQVRSEVLVVGTNPDTNSSAPLAAGVVLGTNPTTGNTSAINFTNVLGGQYRLFLVPGSQTAGFKTAEECQRMAELIGLKILQSYRKGTAQITGHPGLQLDDQVRIFERITNEYNVHYVSGITSRMDMESGEYLMDLTTHWLGNDPDTDWFLDHVQLTPAVQQIPAILKRLGDAGAEPPGPGGSSNDPATGNTSGAF